MHRDTDIRDWGIFLVVACVLIVGLVVGTEALHMSRLSHMNDEVMFPLEKESPPKATFARASVMQ